jgi:hypothetical protein
MELILTLQSGNKVLVTCVGQHYHTFDLLALIPIKGQGPPQPLDDPVAYGQALYRALFLSDTPAQRALDLGPPQKWINLKMLLCNSLHSILLGISHVYLISQNTCSALILLPYIFN